MGAGEGVKFDRGRTGRVSLSKTFDTCQTNKIPCQEILAGWGGGVGSPHKVRYSCRSFHRASMNYKENVAYFF
jgi:hypothetical protein